MKHIPLRKIISLIIFLIAIPLSVFLVQQTQIWWQKAQGKPANIVVDTKTNLGSLPSPWRALAQGGEEKEQMLTNVVSAVKPLSPKYIRIDHLYDFYEVVKKENGQLIFDWTKLDKVINQILQIGATPFFSLSYMPSVIAQDSEITNLPINWNDWSIVVRETIHHYSGKNNRNLNGVIYEVWNEPDLFGGWKIGGEKDYRLLYQYAVLGQIKSKTPILSKLAVLALLLLTKPGLMDSWTISETIA